MTRRTAQAHENSGAIDFDAALEVYLNGGSHEELLRAAGKVIDCHLPFAPEHADTISKLTDHLDLKIETYGDAAHAIWRWFFQMREPGARHSGHLSMTDHLTPIEPASAVHDYATGDSESRPPTHDLFGASDLPRVRAHAASRAFAAF